MDEKPDNAMDKVLRANRERAETNITLVNAAGEHLADVTKVYPGDLNPIVEWKGRYFLPVSGLRNVWRETRVSRVAEV